MTKVTRKTRVREVTAVAIFTLLVIVGAIVVLLVAVRGLADLFHEASKAPLEQKTVSVGLATGVFFVGLWGIASRRMRLHQRIRELEVRIDSMKDTMERQGPHVKVVDPRP